MPADQLTGRDPWWQVYVEFIDWAASERTFARHLEPLLRAVGDDGLVDAWWFMRKHPCWRLRVGLRSDPRVVRETFGTALDGLANDGAIRRWWPGVYEPEEAAFGGPEGMATAHNLFAADSSAVMSLLNRGQDSTGLGSRELSVVLCAAMLHGAGLEWYEQGDAWHRVTAERPLPGDVADSQVRGLTDDVKALLAADTSPGSRLFQPSAPLAEFAEWAAAFRQVGRELGTLARSGTLQRGLREILSYHVIFHWNRLGLPARQQAILARAARDAILGPVPDRGRR